MEKPGENSPSHLNIDSRLEKILKYMTYLEERVRELEKQNRKRSADQMNEFEEDTASSCESNYDDCCAPNESLPEVNARVLEKEVLIAIHCEKRNDIINKILTQLEHLQLSVISSSILPFGNLTLEITIIAEMGDECKMTVNGLVKSLRLALLK